MMSRKRCDAPCKVCGKRSVEPCCRNTCAEWAEYQEEIRERREKRVADYRSQTFPVSREEWNKRVRGARR